MCNVLDFYSIVKVSRPHIWLYTAGSFMAGAQIGGVLGGSISLGLLCMGLVALTIPVNMFIYGLNDYYDSESDAHNPKKEFLESRSFGHDTSLLIAAAAGFTFTAAVFLSQGVLAAALFIFWALIVATYNIPFLRLKGVPGLDMLFALNFPLWGVIGYVLSQGSLPATSIYIALVPFAMSLHLYTAVHDRQYDAQSGLITSAVYVGSLNRNLLLCIALVLPAIVYFSLMAWWGAVCAGLLYIFFYGAHFVLGSLRNNLFFAYTLFLVMQYIAGFVFMSSVLLYLL